MAAFRRFHYLEGVLASVTLQEGGMLLLTRRSCQLLLLEARLIDSTRCDDRLLEILQRLLGYSRGSHRFMRHPQ